MTTKTLQMAITHLTYHQFLVWGRKFRISNGHLQGLTFNRFWMEVDVDIPFDFIAKYIIKEHQ